MHYHLFHYGEVMLILLLILWYLIGLGGFLFWFSKDWDIKLDALLLGMVCAVVGPFTWILGWFIHGEPLKLADIVLIKKRKSTLSDE